MKPKPDPSPLRCGRRTFLKTLLQEAAVRRDAFKGKPSYRVAELGELPDADLAQIRPAVNPACEITLDQGYVCARFRDTGKVQQLFPHEQINLTVFNMFNGRNTLAAVAERLSREPGWDEATAFAHTKALFLSLALRMVCLPGNAPEP